MSLPPSLCALLFAGIVSSLRCANKTQGWNTTQGSTSWNSTSLNSTTIWNGSLPIVNLGYERHQAITYNDTAKFYNFSNIRYAQAPIGNLRFKPPVAPVTSNSSSNSSAVNYGTTGRVCPASKGAWSVIASEFVPYYLLGLPGQFNWTNAVFNLGSAPGAEQRDPRTTEDCLFLDVIVPESVFKSSNGSAPVLVWIFGGGYTSNEKTGQGAFNPVGLLGQAEEPFIFVAMNYRLGALGWLGASNNGLLDQRLALEWVQKYIHLFGGSKDRVTLMGESSGGGSVEHQITAYGGTKGRVPFSQAILISPGFIPGLPPSTIQSTQDDYLKLLNVDTLDEARSLSSEAVIRANEIQEWPARYGGGNYGPAVDNSFVPALPGQLLLNGKFDQNVRILVSHNLNEGVVFTPPWVISDEVYRRYVNDGLPGASSEVMDDLVNNVYPPTYNGNTGYANLLQRTSATIGEGIFACNSYFLASALAGKSYAYEFAVPPAIHGQGLDYVFNIPGTGSSGYKNTTIAKIMQQQITSFISKGKPVAPGVIDIPLYDNTTDQLLYMDNSGITIKKDDMAKPRCDWWQQGYFAQ